jgi:hypothetical protein
MCDSAPGIATGREVYNLLWDLQTAGKHAYVLASHSHFVVKDSYRTPYWGDHVLPGWIVGTAGAVRYRLPPDIGSRFAQTDVYGYLLASVMKDGSINFEFHDLRLDDFVSPTQARLPTHWWAGAMAKTRTSKFPRPKPAPARNDFGHLCRSTRQSLTQLADGWPPAICRRIVPDPD